MSSPIIMDKQGAAAGEFWQQLNYFYGLPGERQSAFIRNASSDSRRQIKRRLAERCFITILGGSAVAGRNLGKLNVTYK